MLRSRERAFLVLGGAAVAVILLVFFAVIPAVSKVRSLSRASALAERELAEVRAMRPELERLDREVRPRAARVAAVADAPESVLSRLTAAIQEAGFPQSAIVLKAAGTRAGEYFSEESFDLKIDNITYLEAVNLLARFENGPLPVVV
ncbi:MAG: hypothetical protein ACM3NF_11250, partial [Gemmatimonadota bacterium]